MSDSLYEENTLAKFWRLTQTIEDEVWNEAIHAALLALEFPCQTHSEILDWSLGEGCYGNADWRLPFVKQGYYLVKPFIPKFVSKSLRRRLCSHLIGQKNSHEHWPIEDRYTRYLWCVMSKVMDILDLKELDMVGFWPQKKQNAFVLTHDVETNTGQKFVDRLAEIDASFGFRSAFFFVADRYPVDFGLLQSLVDRGNEVGVHGYKHDGKLFCLPGCPSRRYQQINEFAEKINAKSFRSPMTLRNPYQMQNLEMAYELSFFDTDPFEPMPGGTMSIHPFSMGKLLELPYTLPQDYTVFELLKETTPRIWVEKVKFLKKYHGMILLDSHPDYLQIGNNLSIYTEFLAEMQKQENSIYHALPSELGTWWKRRVLMSSEQLDFGASVTTIIKNPKNQELAFAL